VALRAFSRSPDEIRACLLGFDFWARPVDEKSSQNKRERDDYRHKNMSKGHSTLHPTSQCQYIEMTSSEAE
jgi:hypothetical protein